MGQRQQSERTANTRPLQQTKAPFWGLKLLLLLQVQTLEVDRLHGLRQTVVGED